jgi:peptidoglycan/LPS O-acetylase OafA/YrhL
MSKNERQSQRFVELDYLRGFAAICVVAFHFFYKGPLEGWLNASASAGKFTLASYGYLGVHLFFIISGFVIMMSAHKAGARQFLVGRAARLYPAMLACATLTFIAMSLIAESPFKASVFQYLLSLTLVPEWFNVEPLDGAYWSLVIEVNFYLMIWLVIVFKQMSRIEWFLAFWLLASIVNFLVPIPNFLKFFLNLSWAPLFVAGACFFRLRTMGPSLLRLLLLVGSFIFSALYAVRAVWHSASVNPFVVAGIVSCFFLVFCFFWLSKVRLKANSLATFLGLVTYPLYLVHQNIGYAVLNLIGKFNSALPNAVVILILSGLFLLIAWVIHRLVERPLSRAIKSTFA